MADFYSTIIAAGVYHTDRGNTTWTGADELLNAAMLRGSEYIDQAYRSAFPGFKTLLREQLREWPRSDATDVEGNWLDASEVPIEVMNATYEAALRELVSPGSLLPDYTPVGLQKKVKVDVIEVEYLLPNGAQASLPVIPIINGILEPILTGTTASGIAGRAVRT
jgi:hypothetical protein